MEILVPSEIRVLLPPGSLPKRGLRKWTVSSTNLVDARACGLHIYGLARRGWILGVLISSGFVVQLVPTAGHTIRYEMLF